MLVSPLKKEVSIPHNIPHKINAKMKELFGIDCVVEMKNDTDIRRISTTDNTDENLWFEFMNPIANNDSHIDNLVMLIAINNQNNKHFSAAFKNDNFKPIDDTRKEFETDMKNKCAKLLKDNPELEGDLLIRLNYLRPQYWSEEKTAILNSLSVLKEQQNLKKTQSETNFVQTEGLIDIDCSNKYKKDQYLDVLYFFSEVISLLHVNKYQLKYQEPKIHSTADDLFQSKYYILKHDGENVDVTAVIKKYIGVGGNILGGNTRYLHTDESAKEFAKMLISYVNNKDRYKTSTALYPKLITISKPEEKKLQSTVTQQQYDEHEEKLKNEKLEGMYNKLKSRLYNDNYIILSGKNLKSEKFFIYKTSFDDKTEQVISTNPVDITFLIKDFNNQILTDNNVDVENLNKTLLDNINTKALECVYPDQSKTTHVEKLGSCLNSGRPVIPT